MLLPRDKAKGFLKEFSWYVAQLQRPKGKKTRVKDTDIGSMVGSALVSYTKNSKHTSI